MGHHVLWVIYMWQSTCYYRQQLVRPWMFNAVLQLLNGRFLSETVIFVLSLSRENLSHLWCLPSINSSTDCVSSFVSVSLLSCDLWLLPSNKLVLFPVLEPADYFRKRSVGNQLWYDNYKNYKLGTFLVIVRYGRY